MLLAELEKDDNVMHYCILPCDEAVELVWILCVCWFYESAEDRVMVVGCSMEIYILVCLI